jgi:two-component system, response regulator RegA
MLATVERLLVVEDVAALARAFEAALSGRARRIECARSVAEACQALHAFEPEVVVLDVTLPDGDAFDVLMEARRLAKVPAVVAVSGAARPEESFHLAQLGVRQYLKKPVTAEALDAAVTAVITTPPDLEPYLRAMVGHRPVRDVEAEVRRTMVHEALARSRGSRRGAARLLALSRQLLQHILRGEAP